MNDIIHIKTNKWECTKCGNVFVKKATGEKAYSRGLNGQKIEAVYLYMKAKCQGCGQGNYCISSFYQKLTENKSLSKEDIPNPDENEC